MLILKDDQLCLREIAEDAVFIKMMPMCVEQTLQGLCTVTGRSVFHDLDAVLRQLLMRDDRNRLTVRAFDQQSAGVVYTGTKFDRLIHPGQVSQSES